LVQVADKGDKTAVAQLDSLFKASAHYGVPVLFTLPEGGTLPKSLKNSVEVITLPPLTPDQHALQLKQFVTEQDIAMEQKHLNTLIGLLNQTDSAKIKAMTQTAAALAAKDQQAIDGKLQVTSEHLNEALAYHANP
ncbi:MAG TPA: hypothetical protein DCE41_24655, partial [Cytophagales bacterium]|nr:hypothetical protein [Cytophagales bacterium]